MEKTSPGGTIDRVLITVPSNSFTEPFAGIHGQQSTAETTTQATSDLAHIPSATSGKDAEQGTTPPDCTDYGSVTKLALGLTSSPNHQDASKAVPSSGNPDATGGADKQLVSKNGSPIDDPVKHAWPVARKSVGTKKLIDF